MLDDGVGASVTGDSGKVMWVNETSVVTGTPDDSMAVYCQSMAVSRT